MVKKHEKNKKDLSYYTFSYGKRTFRFIGDKVLVFNTVKKLHGRFWGVAGLLIMTVLFGLCFLINPEMLDWSTAISDFGKDAKTAPYLAAGLFFGAYGLWRWRNYLNHTLKHSRPVTSLVTLTVAGLYIAALFPIAWGSWPYRVHIFGVMLFGVSMAATVVVDTLLTRTRRKKGFAVWRFLRLISFLLIIIGGYLTLTSTPFVGWNDVTLLGELMMFIGYSIWIIDKTYRGEGARSRLSKLFRGFVLID